ncbi:hypothetical protein [Pilibacter termitis]|uniref:hypothetical protein n=1 Tax=Pilibacter termitis TaxID=263852 RepID=UPI001186CF18|nr:hypothetical protein [Pilibacter termitis]
MKTKSERGVQEFVAVSHSIYLLETQFPVLLRTATQLLPLIARQEVSHETRHICSNRNFI